MKEEKENKMLCEKKQNGNTNQLHETNATRMKMKGRPKKREKKGVGRKLERKKES